MISMHDKTPHGDQGCLEGIVFDIDDTLYSRGDAFRTACCEVFSDIDRLAKLDLTRLYRTFFRRGNEVFEASMNQTITMEEMYIYRIRQAMADFGICITDEQALAFQDAYVWSLQHIKLEAGIESILDCCLQKKIFLGIITNGKHDHQFMKYHSLQLEHWIPESHVLASEDLGVNKPDPRVFHLAAGKFGIAPEKTWYIGDSYDHDILGAHAAGWHSVWLDRHEQAQEISPNVADITVTSVNELGRWIRSL